MKITISYGNFTYRLYPFLKIENEEYNQGKERKSMRETGVGSGEAGRRRKVFFGGVDFRKESGQEGRGWVLILILIFGINNCGGMG